MKRTLLFTAIAALGLVAIACTGAEAKPGPTGPPGDSSSATPPPSDPTREPTKDPAAEPTKPPATPEPTRPGPGEEDSDTPEGLWKQGTRTGNANVDALLDAWEQGDAAALAALVRYQQHACVAQSNGPGGPPVCPEGVAPGTVVDVMLAAQCEGYFVYEDELARLFQSFVDGRDGQPYYLYAAWAAESDGHNPTGYRVQFARTVTGWDLFSPQVILDEEGRIYAYFGGCNPAPTQVPPDADFILEPAA